MTPYQQFIAKSRYSKYLPQDNRREDWPETARRWVDFMQKETPQIDKYDPVWTKVFKAIRDLDTLPSMRSIMTAGPALDRTHISAYNCAYLPVDDMLAFSEAMYILLCGTGVGFSVEKHYVDSLPVVPNELFYTHVSIDVEDSKEGWYYAFKKLIDGLYKGQVYGWDVSKVRPAGSPLKTFGGRASGPDPLVDLFKFTIGKFQSAVGRKLSTLECHDIMCKIGDIVVVGGVRRSAMISLGSLHDSDHRSAKAGEWWKGNPQRRLANNSAVFDGRPSREVFDAEWSELIASGSGERGIFNRAASQEQAAKNGRRSRFDEYGTNPCSEIILRPYQFCNLSTVVVKPNDDLDTLKSKVAMAAFMGTLQCQLVAFPLLRPIWSDNTREEALLGVSMTGIYDNVLLNGIKDPEKLDATLEMLKQVAVNTNKYWAPIIGVNPAAAVTCVKPEGTVSQLTLTSSGIHPSHAKYFIRRVRQDKKDPLTGFLMMQGVPYEDCVYEPESTVVFEYVQKGEGLTRHDLTAIEHLKMWLTYQRHWCEHKPSVTITVKPHEWKEVGDWVYEHFNEVTGVSFMPDDGGTYKQAPYEDCTEEEYNKRLEKLPKFIDWDSFMEFEDNVVGAQTLACTANGCSI